MNKQELKQLLLANFKPVDSVNFSDVTSATKNALTEFYSLKDLSPREISANKAYIMALIEEVIDDVLPEKLESRVGDFAEIKQFARDAEVVFDIKNKGKRRAYLTIKKGQRGGLYQAARLDDIQMSIDTWVETVGVFVTLEEILLGKYSLTDLMNNILDGFVERMYIQVIEALQATRATVPTANQATAAGFLQASIDPIIRVVAAYGQPVIMGFHNVISKISNAQGTTQTPNIPTSDLDAVKSRGYVDIYKSTPIVKLPNYIIDETTNATWMLDEGFLFILPVGSKPVKVALKGDLRIKDTEHPTGSVERNAHKLIGVGLLLQNNIGVYQDTDETAL
jgi:hypothetical protein